MTDATALVPLTAAEIAVYVCLSKSQNSALANVVPFTPHNLRRTFAGDLLHANVDIVTVQKLLGHSNPATTAGYDRRGARARQEAVKHIHVTYGNRTTKPQSETAGKASPLG